MTFTVYKSLVDRLYPNFAAKVEEHRQALLNHRFSPPARQAIPGQPAIPAVAPVLPTPAKGRLPPKPGRPGSRGRSAIAPVAAVNGTAAPSADALIEACIRKVPNPNGLDDYVADYAIVDDTE